MEIKGIGRNQVVTSSNKRVTEKKDFSQNFSFARQRKNQQELKKMMEDIKKKGSRLVLTKCYADVKAYKSMIREYLKSVMEHMYDVKKDVSFWQTQYFVTVETIDMKLEDLTRMLLEEEQENLNVAAMVDDITGLLIDVHK